MEYLDVEKEQAEGARRLKDYTHLMPVVEDTLTRDPRLL